MKARLAVVGLAVVLAAGCKGSNAYLPAGYYSGSTSDDKAVTLVIGEKIKLDGAELRFTRDEWMEGVKDHSLRARCHTQARQSELSCVIVRGSRTETDELLKL